MIEIMRTNDLVTISAVEARLRAAGLHVLVLDGYISALEGGICLLYTSPSPRDRG